MSLLKQDIIKKKQLDNQVNQALPKLKKNLKFEVGDNKKYEVKTIIASIIYSKQTNNQIPGLYYLIL